jgi:hypothetical protein
MNCSISPRIKLPTQIHLFHLINILFQCEILNTYTAFISLVLSFFFLFFLILVFQNDRYVFVSCSYEGSTSCHIYAIKHACLVCLVLVVVLTLIPTPF